MKMQPTAWFWIVAAAVAAVAAFTVGNAYGQSTGAQAVFEGRPAMAGAQAGTGPQAGPPQGGVGPQATGDPGGGAPLRGPADVQGAGPSVPRDTPGLPGVPTLPRDPGVDRPNDGMAPQRDRGGDVVKRERDTGGVTEGSRATGKAKRATKRSVERARRGVSGVDS